MSSYRISSFVPPIIFIIAAILVGMFFAYATQHAPRNVVEPSPIDAIVEKWSAVDSFCPWELDDVNLPCSHPGITLIAEDGNNKVWIGCIGHPTAAVGTTNEWIISPSYLNYLSDGYTTFNYIGYGYDGIVVHSVQAGYEFDYLYKVWFDPTRWQAVFGE